jgi:hypothetical protein
VKPDHAFPHSRAVGVPTCHLFNQHWSYMPKRIPMKPIDRSSITGRFVTPEYADKHPRTTEHEHVPIHNPKK